MASGDTECLRLLYSLPGETDGHLTLLLYDKIGTRQSCLNHISLLEADDLIGRDGDRKPSLSSFLRGSAIDPVMLRVSGLLKANPGQERGPCSF